MPSKRRLWVQSRRQGCKDERVSVGRAKRRKLMYSLSSRGGHDAELHSYWAFQLENMQGTSPCAPIRVPNTKKLLPSLNASMPVKASASSLPSSDSAPPTSTDACDGARLGTRYVEEVRRP